MVELACFIDWPWKRGIIGLDTDLKIKARFEWYYSRVWKCRFGVWNYMGRRGFVLGVNSRVTFLKYLTAASLSWTLVILGSRFRISWISDIGESTAWEESCIVSYQSIRECPLHRYNHPCLQLVQTGNPEYHKMYHLVGRICHKILCQGPLCLEEHHSARWGQHSLWFLSSWYDHERSFRWGYVDPIHLRGLSIYGSGNIEPFTYRASHRTWD